MARVLLIAGTRGRRDPDPWWRAGSPFVAALRAHGHELIGPRGGQLWKTPIPGWGWSTALDGVLPWRRRRVWRGAGYSLMRYGLSYPGLIQAIIAYSHGGQPAAYALSYGLRVPVLVTVATPARGDMQRVYRRARRQVGRWAHITTPWDPWQALGGLLDGRIGVWRAMPGADHVPVPGRTHRSLLDPLLWSERGWWAWLGPPDAARHSTP